MTSAENNQLIADVARDIVAQTAPEELLLFRVTSAEYFKNPEKALKQHTGKDEMLGFGGGDVVILLTPMVLTVMTEVFTFAVATVKESLVKGSADLLNESAKKLFKRFRTEGKNEADTPTPFTLHQISRVHTLAYEKFLQLKLSEALANRLADAVVATLVSETSY
ncbi:MAG: hypothetical protein NVS4B12_13220 [Ktedonobacteraceae bacterium]